MFSLLSIHVLEHQGYSKILIKKGFLNKNINAQLVHGMLSISFFFGTYVNVFVLIIETYTLQYLTNISLAVKPIILWQYLYNCRINNVSFKYGSDDGLYLINSNSLSAKNLFTQAI